MIEGWDRCRELADGEDHVVPGHDPHIIHRYPRAGDDKPDIVRLDEDPSGPIP